MKRFLLLMINVCLVASLLTGCGAVAWPLGVGETVQGISAAARGMPGTFAYMSQTSPIIVLGWPAGDGRYAFILVDQVGEMVQMNKICNANCVSWKTAAEFLKWIEANGWTSVPAGMLPPALLSAIGQTAFLTSLARVGLPTMLVVPAAVLDLDPFKLLQPDAGGA